MNFLKYQRIVQWAKNRYTIDSILILDIGQVPSVYSRIENAAFIKYVRRIPA